MVTNMLYGGPFRDMRLLQEEVNLTESEGRVVRARERGIGSEG